MNGYRKPSGVYMECTPGTPVADTLVPVARRPSPSHTFADSWQTDPLNPAVCWRLKTAGEQHAERDGELQEFLDSAGGKALKALVMLLVNKSVITVAEVRALYRTY